LDRLEEKGIILNGRDYQNNKEAVKAIFDSVDLARVNFAQGTKFDKGIRNA
jgi:hypothetical protein